MAVVKIHEIVLYTSDVYNALEGHKAAAWLDHADIKYMRLNYNNEEACSITMQSLNTWWQGKKVTANSWPFITYKEEHDDRPSYMVTANFIEGLDNIQNILPTLPI